MPDRTKDGLALCIPQWFARRDGVATHEATNHGRPFLGPLKWFSCRVHRGETRKLIRERAGTRGEDAAISVYDAVLQLSAAQEVRWRGWLMHRNGAPMTVAELAMRMEREVSELQTVIDLLVEVGWLDWRRTSRPLPGAWRVRRDGTISAPYKHKQTDSNRHSYKYKQSADVAPAAAECADEPPAALPASLPDGTGERPANRGAFGLLKLAGFDVDAAHEIADMIGGDAHRVAEAIEAADVMAAGGELKGSRQGYIRGWLTNGPYHLPGKLQAEFDRRVNATRRAVAT